MNLKMHYAVVKYKLNAFSYSTNISNARALTPKGPKSHHVAWATTFVENSIC